MLKIEFQVVCLLWVSFEVIFFMQMFETMIVQQRLKLCLHKMAPTNNVLIFVQVGIILVIVTNFVFT